MGYLIFIALLLVALFAWLLHGATNSRLRKAEDEADAYEDIRFKDAEADRATRDSDLDKRVRKKYGNR